MRYPQLIILSIFLVSCNLTKDITVPLPPYSPTVVVECYLESGRPLRALVTRSNSFFDTALIPSPAGKSVVIFINERRYELESKLSVDSTFKNRPKVFNFFSSVSPVILPGDICRIEVQDDKSDSKLTARTIALPVIKIDSVGTKFYSPEDTLAYLAVYITDVPEQKNFYRIFITATEKNGNEQIIDFAFSDNNVNGQTFPVVTRPRYYEGQKIIIRLYHISQDYFDFINTIEAAKDFTGGNPFFQPAVIKSNIKGGTGIFTALCYDEVTLTAKR